MSFIFFTRNMQTFWAPVTAAAIPNTVILIEAIALRKQLRSSWYEKLKKPSWAPRLELLGLVSNILYVGLGYASYLVWRNGGGFTGPACLPLVLYGSQLVLFWLWIPIFFGARDIRGSLIDAALLWMNTAACGRAFYGVSHTAGYFFIPYFAWITLETVVNYSLYKLNSN